jgi:hypothetical protein
LAGLFPVNASGLSATGFEIERQIRRRRGFDHIESVHPLRRIPQANVSAGLFQPARRQSRAPMASRLCAAGICRILSTGLFARALHRVGNPVQRRWLKPVITFERIVKFRFGNGPRAS